MKKYTIYLITGLVATIVLLLLSGTILDAMFSGQTEFANEMYNNNLYRMTTLFSVIYAWVLAGVFYYVINSVSFSRWYHWLIVLAIACVVSSITTYTYCDGIFTDDGVDYSDQLFGFAMTNLLVEALFFIIASYSMRWWSSNCRHTPIPE
ncbi:MAG: hypothetical protein ACOYJG_08510 [Prevotella sp.]|jgi:uncharacterized membrane protein